MFSHTNPWIGYAATVKDAVDVKQVAESYGITFNRNGFAPCCFHGEKTASLKAQNHKYLHCFGCGVNADAIKLVQHLFAVSFSDAVRKLNSDFGVGLALDRKQTLREQQEQSRRHTQILQQQQAELRRKEAWEKEYWRRFDTWKKCDDLKIKYAPKSPKESFHPLYVYALNHLEKARWDIDNMPALDGFTYRDNGGGVFGDDQRAGAAHRGYNSNARA